MIRTANLRICLAMCISWLVVQPCANGRIIYVDADAAGANDGSSWADAYNYLQDALADANLAEKPIEIRVAQGTYAPDRSSADPNGSGNRTAAFQLVNGVTIKGGYAGFREPDPNARDLNTYQTILNGDLADNDVHVDDPFELYEDPSRADNSFRVVTAKIADPNTIVEGIVITGAYAYNPENVDYRGAGLYADSDAHITVRECVFEGNAAPGVYCVQSSPTFEDCVFKNNAITESGGGMFIGYGGSPHLVRCTFEGNWAPNGGGLHNQGGRLWLEGCIFAHNVACGPRCADVGCGGGLFSQFTVADSQIKNCSFIANIASTGGAAHFGLCGTPPPPARRGEKILLAECTFARNQAPVGGAISQWASTLDITHSVFSENSALHIGGAIHCLESTTSLDHCTFSGNSASVTGASIFARGSQITWGDRELSLEFVLTLNSCTFRGNLAPTGRVLACRAPNSQHVDRTLIADCIFNNGGNEIHNPDGSQITIAYTDLRSGADSVYDPCESTSWGEGNIDVDPLFTDPGYWDPNGTPDDANDDFWVDGDYHLRSQAGRWDPVSQTWVQDDITSPCIDAGDAMSPIGQEPFPNGGIINMGAYGGTAEASKSYYGEPVCETIVAGDINGDCKVDFLDFAIMSLHWLEDNRL
jgi:predicted outer membrane repeat protein